MRAWKDAKGSPKLDGKKRGRPPKDAPKDSPPAKKPKGRGKGRKPEQSQNGAQLDTAVAAQAAKLNLESALMNLVAREEIKAKGLSTALKAKAALLVRVASAFVQCN